MERIFNRRSPTEQNSAQKLAVKRCLIFAIFAAANGLDGKSDEEAHRRFMAAMKAGLNTPPKPLKSVTRMAFRRN